MSHVLGAWFEELGAADRAALQERGAKRRYQPGSRLFHEEDISDWVTILNTGRVKVSAVTSEGKEVVLAICGPGELLGELSAIDGGSRSATATAIDVVEAQIVPAEEFRAFLAGTPQASLALLRSLSGRLRESDRRRVEFVALDSVGRVARQVVELVERYGVSGDDGSTRVDIPLTQDDLAGMTGASREAVGKALQLFRRRAWISTGRRSITVLRLDALRSRAT